MTALMRWWTSWARYSWLNSMLHGWSYTDQIRWTGSGWLQDSGWGTRERALLTGESKPVHKQKKDLLIGGSLVSEGTVKAPGYCSETIRCWAILNLVKQASEWETSCSAMANKISAVFVPGITGPSGIDLSCKPFCFHIPGTASLIASSRYWSVALRHGFGNPAAIAVGLGREPGTNLIQECEKPLSYSAISGWLFDKQAHSPKEISTLPASGRWELSDEEFKPGCFLMENFPPPHCKTITDAWKQVPFIRKKIEKKGPGMKAEDAGQQLATGFYQTVEKALTNI